MKILANENLPLRVIASLRARGHDVVWARSEMPGATDEAVLVRAQDEERLLLTLDKDFGEAAYRRSLPAASDIVLIQWR